MLEFSRARTIFICVSDYFLNRFPEIHLLWQRIESLFKALDIYCWFLLRKMVQIKVSLAIFDCFHYSAASFTLNNTLILVRPCILIRASENIASYPLCFVQSPCSIEVDWQNDNRELGRVFVEVRMDFKADRTFCVHPGVSRGNQNSLFQMERWELLLNLSVW